MMVSKLRFLFLAAIILFVSCIGSLQGDFVRMFNGQNFEGWEGDTLHTWHISNETLYGGSLKETVPNNNFLSTKKTYTNFILKLKFKLTGKEGFINSGVQFHSQRLTKPAYEMVGYQADLGKDYWASLYDESRRNKTLAAPDSNLIRQILKPQDWNDYEVRSESGRIRIFLNGKQTVDYREKDASVPQSGHIALQIHGGGKALVAFRDIWIKEL